MNKTVFRIGPSLLLGMFLFPMAGALAASVEVPVPAPSRLAVLEYKASEYERYRTQYLELQKILDDMLALLPGSKDEQGTPSPKAGVGQLSALLEKASQADRLALKVDWLQAECDRVRKQLDILKEDLATVEAERDQAVKDATESSAAAEQWKSKVAGLRETIERLLLGQFEYYEVKQGETLQSIAANPLVYGDPTRAVWLRQVNEGKVKHIDNLQPGEVLVVPRFPRNGTYEF